MIRFRQIEAFRVLMSTGTTVGAAKRLHISQPAVSRLIADLEQDLGFSLFNRSKGRMEPTKAAVRFHLAVEENFLGLERLRKVADTIKKDACTGLNIACMHVLSTTVLPLILKEFSKNHPDTPIRIDSVSNAEILVRLQDLKADIALGLAFPEIAGIEVETVLEAPVFCAMPKGHRLADQALITPEDLQFEKVIGWIPSSPVDHTIEDLYFPEPAIKPEILIRTHTSHTRYALVASGLGVSIVEPFASQVWDKHNIVLKPYQTSAKLEYALSYPSISNRSVIVQAFKQAALTVLQDPLLKPWEHGINHEFNS